MAFSENTCTVYSKQSEPQDFIFMAPFFSSLIISYYFTWEKRQNVKLSYQNVSHLWLLILENC